MSSSSSLYSPSWLVTQAHGVWVRWGSFDHNNITDIQNDPKDYGISLIPAPAIAAGLFLLIYFAAMVGSCDWCRKRPEDTYEPVDPNTAVVPKAEQWWQIVSIVTLALAVGTVIVQFVYQSKINDDGNALLNIGTEATDYQTRIETSVTQLQTELELEHTLSVQVLQQNRTVPPSVLIGMQQTSTDLASASNNAHNMADQVNKDLGIKNIVDQGHTYIKQENLYSFIWIGLWALFVVAVALASFVEPSDIHMVKLRSCVRITSFVYAGVFMFISILIGAVLAFGVPMALSDACINHSSWLRAEIGSGNADTATYYLDCDHPLTGGPINPNIDDIQSQLQQSITRVSAYINATNGASTESVYLLHNLTQTATDLNVTRQLVSCTTPHDLLREGLHRTCDDVFVDVFVFGLMLLFVPLFFVAFLFERSNPVTVKEPPKPSQPQQQQKDPASLSSLPQSFSVSDE